MSFKHILTEQKSKSFLISINRESKMNALDTELLQEIKEAVKYAQTLESFRGIIITGMGEKAFAAGADISEFAQFSVDEGTKMSAAGHEVFKTIEKSKLPVIAAVNGYALGGGCELAMACHLRFASENALFGQPEVNLGLPPGYGGTQRLIQLIGKGRALQMLMDAKPIDAKTAMDYGLVNKVFNISELVSETVNYIDKLSQKSPQAIAMIIECVNQFYESHESGMNKEIELFGKSFQTPDFIEGTTAFLEKRKPNY